jgi:hypothetical protein
MAVKLCITRADRGVRHMPDYRLYCRDPVGRFTNVHEIAAESDGEALSKARALKIGGRCELWDRGRIVAVIDPHSTH